jgi:hypothetical protein
MNQALPATVSRFALGISIVTRDRRTSSGESFLLSFHDASIWLNPVDSERKEHGSIFSDAFSDGGVQDYRA